MSKELSEEDSYVSSMTKNTDIMSQRIDQTLEILNDDTDTYDFDIKKSDINGAHELANVTEDSEIYNAELKSKIQKIIDDYNTRYQTNVTFGDFSEALSFAATASRENKKVSKIVIDEILSSATEYIYSKSVIVFVSILDKLLNNIQQRSYNESVNEELLAVMDRIMLYQKELKKIRNEHSVSNVESSINTAKNVSTGTNPEDIRIVNDLINSMRRGDRL